MATKLPGLLFHSWRIWFAIPGFILFFVTLFNRQIAKHWLEQWNGFSPWWSVVVLSFLVLWGVMQAIYERDIELYSAYKDVERKALRAAKQLQEVAFKPDIRAEIDQFYCIPFPDDMNSTGVLLVVSIRNLGDPTSLEAWTLEVEFLNGKISEGQIIKLPTEINFKGTDGDHKLKEGDALYNKALTPIARGQALRGVLWFKIPNIKIEAFLPGSQVKLWFNDVLGQKSFAVGSIDLEPVKPMYFPGLSIE
jgi:hypothetical protein